MPNWDFFRRRRRLEVDKWLKAVKVESYDDFCKTLHALGVMPPSIEVYETYRPRPKPEPKPKPEPVATPEPEPEPKPKPKKARKAAPKKPRNSRKAAKLSVVDGDAIVNDENGSND